ncbi:MAG: hypothetical protein M0C28_39175 [Candidatus Moduliflexus flocculans]|nr:hypothetical protein [Candidatus Moduliflexus flocculans]
MTAGPGLPLALRSRRPPPRASSATKSRQEGTDIRIEAAGTNTYRQPWAVGAGCSYRFCRGTGAPAADAGLARLVPIRGRTLTVSPLDRDFRDVVQGGGGRRVSWSRRRVPGRGPSGSLSDLGIALRSRSPWPSRRIRRISRSPSAPASKFRKSLAVDLSGVGRAGERVRATATSGPGRSGLALCPIPIVGIEAR